MSGVFLNAEWSMFTITTLTGVQIDLSACTGLDTLFLRFKPQFSINTHSGFVTQLLTSWRPHHPEPSLVFCVDRQQNLTRRAFVDVLRGLGAITEAWLQTMEESPRAGESGNYHHVKHHLWVHLYDWEAEREWWSDHLDSCFPTWLKLGRLHLSFNTREHTSNNIVVVSTWTLTSEQREVHMTNGPTRSNLCLGTVSIHPELRRGPFKFSAEGNINCFQDSRG